MCIVIAAAFKAASSIARDSTPHRFFYSWKFYVGGDLRPRPLFRAPRPAGRRRPACSTCGSAQ